MTQTLEIVSNTAVLLNVSISLVRRQLWIYFSTQNKLFITFSKMCLPSQDKQCNSDHNSPAPPHDFTAWYLRTCPCSPHPTHTICTGQPVPTPRPLDLLFPLPGALSLAPHHSVHSFTLFRSLPSWHFLSETIPHPHSYDSKTPRPQPSGSLDWTSRTRLSSFPCKRGVTKVITICTWNILSINCTDCLLMHQQKNKLKDR